MMKDDRKTKTQLMEELSTLRRQNDELLKAMTLPESAEDVLRVVGSSMQAGIYIIQDDRTLYTNSHISAYSGYSREDLLSLSLMKETVHPEDRARVRECGIRMLKGQEQAPYEYRIITRDGDIRWLMEKVASIQYGGRRAVLGNTMDITDRRRIENELSEIKENLESLVQMRTEELSSAKEALRISEEKYRGILQNIAEGYYEVDLSGHFTFFNGSMSRLIGYPEGEMKGMDNRTFMDAANAKKVFRTFNEVYRTRMTADCFDVDLRRKDGGIVKVEISISLMVDASGRPFGFRGIVRDVTERKRLEEALRVRERQYRTIFENTGTATVILEEDTTISLANAEFEKLTGYTRQEIEGKKSWTDFVVKDDLDRMLMQHTLRRVADAASQRSYDFRLADKEGRIKNIYLTIDMIPETKKSVASLLDITALKEKDAALGRSEEKYRNMVEFTTDWVWEMDVEGRFTYGNQNVKEILGFQPEEIIGRTPFEYAIPEHSRRVQTIFQRKKPFQHVQGTFIHRDGSLVTLDTSGVPIFDEKGSFAGLRGITRDITELRRAEDALRESEARLRAVFDSVQDFVFIKGLDRRYVLANNFFQKKYAVDMSAFIGRTDAEIPVLDNKDKTQSIVQDTDGRVLQGETVTYEITHIVRGASLTLEIVKTPIRDECGDVVSICGIARDITERKRMEEDLIRARKLESVGVLAGGIAHDFNNLLAAIKGYMELIRMDVPPESRSYKRLLAAELAAQQATDLTKRLITFSRGGAPVRKPCDIGEMVKDTVNRVAAATPVEKKISLDDDLWPVEIDEGQIRQVVRNLAVNAVEAMPAGGLLQARVQNVTIGPMDLLPVQGGAYVRLTIQDSGRGIPGEQLPRIFDPYFSTKEKGTQKGMGLGLSVCHSIVNGHAGHIAVESTLGKGSAFHVYLPARYQE